MTRLYVQTDNSSTFNVGCSGQTAGSTTGARQGIVSGTAGSTEVALNPGNNVTRACFVFDCQAPGDTWTWAAGTWVIPINHTTMDGGTILSRVDVCDYDGSSYTTVASNTSPGHTRGATGVVTVNVTQGSTHTQQDTTFSRPFIVLTYNNSDTHGSSSLGITPNQTITAPLVEITNYTLTADPGSYEQTGTAAALQVGLTISADAGSYAVSGEEMIDSYPSSNQDAEQILGTTSTVLSVSQAFTASASGSLRRARAFLRDDEAGTSGSLTASLHAVTGTVGSSAVPTGSALATSTSAPHTDDIGNYDWHEFTFDGLLNIQSGSSYALVINRGTTDNRVYVGRDGSSSSHGGNYAFFTSSWNAVPSSDMIFELYVDATELTRAAVLTAEADQISLTGTDASLEFSRAVSIDAGSYVVTGTEASLEYGREVLAEAGSYSVNPMAEVLSDSYSEANQNLEAGLDASGTRAAAQCFTASESGLLSRALFYLRNDGIGTSGNIVAQLCAVFGTVGTDAIPTGAVLAESTTVSSSSIGSSLSLVEFIFDGTYQINEGTAYAIIIDHGTTDDLIRVGYDNSTPTHPGNGALDLGGWADFASIDVIFYMYVLQDAVDLVLAGSSNPSIVTDSGSYTLTGITASLELGRAVMLDAGAYEITGTAAGLLKGQTLTADAGAYVITGTDADLIQDRLLTGDAGTYAITGTDASLVQGRTVVLDAGSYTISGTDTPLQYSRIAAIDAGGYTMTGTDVALEFSRTVALDAGSYEITGTDVGLLKGQTMFADPGSYDVSGTEASFLYSRVFTPNAGTYAVTGTDVSLEFNRTVTLDAGAYSITGTDADLLHDLVIATEAGSYDISGTDAALLFGANLDAQAGSYSTTGTEAALIYAPAGTYLINAEAGTYSVSGQLVTLKLDRVLTAEEGAYLLSGQDVNLVYSGDSAGGSYYRFWRIRRGR